jgi:hemoglobin-like flavoprotein
MPRPTFILQADSETPGPVSLTWQIGLAACRIGSSTRVLGILERLGKRHVEYGADLDMFVVLKEAFLIALQKVLGEVAAHF